jgi:hypothetical protein
VALFAALLVSQGAVLAAEGEKKEKKKQEKKTEKKKSWFGVVKFSGDFRFRQQFEEKVSDSGDPANESTSHRSRQRMRARFGFEAKINRDWKLYTRLATGSDDPTSTNQTFDDAFSSKGIRFDQAYVKWIPLHPEKDPKDKKKKTGGCEFNLVAGKMKNHFFKPDKSQLIFDGDVTPEGACAIFHAYLGEKGAVTPFALLGNYWLNEEKKSHDDPMLGVFQVGALFKVGKGKLKIGAGYFGFNCLRGHALLNDGGKAKNHGNTVNGNDEYVESYHLTNIFAEYSVKLGNCHSPFMRIM